MPADAAGGATTLKIGTEVDATDGPCGKLAGVVVDPVTETLTHLIVQPHRHHGFGRLVPLELVESDGDPIRLNVATAEFEEQDEGDDIQLVKQSREWWDYTGGQAYQWPHYDLGLVGGLGAGGMGDIGAGHSTPQEIYEPTLPAGEVEVRRGDQVHASDGKIGSVKGLIVDPANYHVTHMLLAEGHLWGRKEVAIPIGATARIGAIVKVEMTKDQIGRLPPVELPPDRDA